MQSGVEMMADHLDFAASQQRRKQLFYAEKNMPTTLRTSEEQSVFNDVLHVHFLYLHMREGSAVVLHLWAVLGNTTKNVTKLEVVRSFTYVKVEIPQC